MMVKLFWYYYCWLFSSHLSPFFCPLQGLIDTQTVLSEQRVRYHFEAKMAAHGNPMILSANVSRELGRKTSFSAVVKNVFRESATLSGSHQSKYDSNFNQIINREEAFFFLWMRMRLSLPVLSGPGAQAGKKQWTVLGGGRCTFARCDR